MPRVKYMETVRSCWAISGHHSPCTSKYSPSYKLPYILGICMEASSWSILIPRPALLPFLEAGVWHVNFQASNCLGLCGDQPPTKNPSSHLTVTQDVLITQGITKDLGALVGTIERDQYLFSISSHSSIRKLQIPCMLCATSFFRWNQAALQTQASITPECLHGNLSSKCPWFHPSPGHKLRFSPTSQWACMLVYRKRSSIYQAPHVCDKHSHLVESLYHPS